MTKYSPATRKITCNRGKGKVTFSIFVESDYNDLFHALVSSSQAWALLISAAPGASKLILNDVSATPIKYKDSFSTYGSTILNTTFENLVEMHNKLDIMSITIAHVSDLTTKLSAMSEQVDSLNDLLLSAYFKIDSVKDVMKETSVDVARIRIKLY
ncbi:hypothetical protein EJD97_009211 [Solanum chilense]|uniref:Uncharacterized protein n=1 Tax=Solanum chilense TaxID=4083 RepID=A0A6N2BKI7_SOLCI|nr:hypothetical protein EJD97_009211 [Solanum chilense]